MGTGTNGTAPAPAGSGAVKEAHRAMWASGDYPRISRDVLAELGPQLVAACGIRPGQRVLDIAAGSGNAAIPAAAVGASVVASDLTPELLAAGERDAAAAGLALEWLVADAEDLPFPDADFDVVMSCIGAMFAPRHQVVADEMLRVCRPGGTVGMLNWAPTGTIAEFFATLAPYVPAPPPGATPPVRWGDETHVRALFGDRADGLTSTAGRLVVEHFADAEAFCGYYKAHFGPVRAAVANVAGDRDRSAALDRDFLAYARRHDRSGGRGPARFEWEFRIFTARRRPG